MPYKDIEKAKAAKRRYYEENKQRLFESQNIKRSKLRRFVTEYKDGKPCMDCGINYPYYVMDFDHRPGTEKKFEVGSLANCSSLAVLEAEIAKCDLVCANCHRHRTFMRVAKSSAGGML